MQKDKTSLLLVRSHMCLPSLDPLPLLLLFAFLESPGVDGGAEWRLRRRLLRWYRYVVEIVADVEGEGSSGLLRVWKQRLGRKLCFKIVLMK
jgi:hypothetical protein